MNPTQKQFSLNRAASKKQIPISNNICLLSLALAGLLLTGCAAFQTSTTQNLPAVVEEKPTPDKALIIVEGTESFGGMFKLYAAAMYDADTFVGKVGPHGRLAWLRLPGIMDLSMNHAISRRVTVVAGKKYHYKLNCGSALVYSIDDLMCLEGLLTVHITPQIKPDLLQAIATSQNLINLQKAVDKTSDPEIKTAAQSRLATVVSTSTNLNELIAIRGKVRSPDLERSVEQRLTKLQEEKRIVEAAKKQRITQNLDKLRVGMPIDEVESLLGPFPGVFTSTVISCSKHPGAKWTVITGPTGGLKAETGNPKESIFTLNEDLFSLTFDWEGKLKEFRKQ